MPTARSTAAARPRGARVVCLFGAAAAVALALAGCSGDDELGTTTQAANGSWTLPAEVSAAGAQVSVQYDDAPAWTGGGCGGGLREGAAELGRVLEQQFSQISSVGGYSCRANTANSSKMSVHGTGRALDVFVPDSSDEGDQVANWLVTNAQTIGVQLIIWDRTVWRANGTNTKRYTGPHPHNDHIHVEVNEEAAAKRTAFFTGGGTTAPAPAVGPAQNPPATTGPQQEEPPEYVPPPATPNPTPTPYDPYGQGNPPPQNPYGTNPQNPYPGYTPGPSSQPGYIPTAPNGTGNTGIPTTSGTPPGTTTIPNKAPTPAPTPPVMPSLADSADQPSGQQDSLGTGVRKPKTKAKAAAIESGCAASNVAPRAPQEAFGPLLLVGLGAVLARLRRHPRA